MAALAGLMTSSIANEGAAPAAGEKRDMSADAKLGDTHATITPEKVAEMKARIGMVTLHQPLLGENLTEAHFDTMKRYAIGIGDDNPLWCDPSYAATTRWKEPIAFPTYNVGGLEEGVPEGRQVMPKGDPLRGLHSFFVGADTTYYRPIYGGDRTATLGVLENVEEKVSEFSGRSVIVTYMNRVKNQRGDVVKVVRRPYIHTERGTAKKKEKLAWEATRYTEEDIAKIDAAYEAETRRGAEPLFWEDVNAGEVVPGVVKGPYTVKDWIAFCIGVGLFGAFGAGAWRMDYLNRKRVPKFYMPTADGIPKSAYACHYDPEVAATAGVPAPYDLGAMREAFLVHMLSNWIGDHGFVHRTFVEVRKFNYLGDVQWCGGQVTGKRREGDLNIVDIEMWCDNQRGERTTKGTAAVLLPSRETGAVRLPDPPRDLP